MLTTGGCKCSTTSDFPLPTTSDRKPSTRRRWRRSAIRSSWRSRRPAADITLPASAPTARPDFWIGDEGGLNRSLHIAITAKDRAAVDAFYRAAIAAGAKDNGAPGLRPHYHPNYYGAFVIDPDGHNIEAVCHSPA